MTTDDKTASCEGVNFTLNHPTREYVTGLTSLADISLFLYIHGSVRRDSILIKFNEMQQYAGASLLQSYSTSFGCLSHPSSGVNQTVTAASGTRHIKCQNNNLPPPWPN